MSDGITNEFRELVAAACNGTLPPLGVITLETTLLGNDEAQTYFLDYMRLDAELNLLCEQQRSLDVLHQVERAQLDEPELTLGERAWDLFIQPSALSLLVAGLFMTTFVLSLAMITMPAWHEPDRAIGTDRADFVARVVRTHQAEWSEATEVEENRVSELLRGQRLELRAGKVEIAFDRGARITIEGPTTITLTDDNACQLAQGQLSANVPPEASGFLVSTLQAEIVDLGTEFGVRSEPGAETLVSCFVGEIQVSLVAGDPPEKPLLLAAGESLSIAADGRSAQSSPIGRMARRISFQHPTLDVLAETDFATIKLAGTTATNIHWTTAGLRAPSQLTALELEQCGDEATAPVKLFTTDSAQGYFVPKRNLHIQGPWSVVLPLTVSGDYEIQRIEIFYRQFNADGLWQAPIEREIRLTATLMESASGQEHVAIGYRSLETIGRAVLTFEEPIAASGDLQLTLCVSGDGRGTHLGIDGLRILGLPATSRPPTSP